MVLIQRMRVVIPRVAGGAITLVMGVILCAGKMYGAALDITPETIGDALDAHRIPHETAAVKTAMAEALIRAIDPAACVVEAAEARRLEQRRDGLYDPGFSLAAPEKNKLISTPRSMPAIAPVEWWPRGVAYVQLNGLYPGSRAKCVDVFSSAATGAVGGVVLDLRQARGCDAETIAAVAALVIETPSNAPLFKIQDRAGTDIEAYSSPLRKIMVYPVMVLIGPQTIEGAELLAALWKGAPGVLLVGSATTGESLIRNSIPLADGYCLWIATRQWVPLLGSLYEGKGVQPDIEVSQGPWMPASVSSLPATNSPPQLTERPAPDKADSQLMDRIGNDPVVRRAVDVLVGLKALGVKNNEFRPAPAAH